MNKVYLYIENEYKEDCIKYGIKLSEYANKIINYNKSEKRVIIGFLSPKDSDLYYNPDFTCLTVRTDKLKVLIANNVVSSDNYSKTFITDISKYNLGDYEEPLAFICSSILPESITEYNKEKDYPILVQNSKDFYYQKAINNMLASNIFSNLEIYQLLLLLGEKKNIFRVTNVTDKLKIYHDLYANKDYTKKNNFNTD